MPPPMIILLYVAKGILHLELSALLTHWVKQKEDFLGGPDLTRTALKVEKKPQQGSPEVNCQVVRGRPCDKDLGQLLEAASKKKRTLVLKLQGNEFC